MKKLSVKTLLAASLFSMMVCSGSALAQEVEVVNISKIAGMPWFNRMGEGVERAGKDLGIKAYQVGPSSTDAPQQVKIIEDLIAKKVSAISIVPNDADVLEPVFKKARDAG
ncbi:TPA: substrate-binding domain-containing protein, partial [Yersinia enterocolitica]|nr:substrate-binding domain-containing protein [Yersinia enterocolitica]